MSPTRPNQMTIGCRGGADITPLRLQNHHKLCGSGRPWQASLSFRKMRAFTWFLVLMVLALAAIALFAYPAWTVLHPRFDFPFHRIGERIGMLALLAGFLLVARQLRLADRGSLRYGRPRGAFPRQRLHRVGPG